MTTGSNTSAGDLAAAVGAVDGRAVAAIVKAKRLSWYEVLCAIAAGNGWSVKAEAVDPGCRNCLDGTPAHAATLTRGQTTVYIQTRTKKSGREAYDVFDMVDEAGKSSRRGYSYEGVDVLRGGTGEKTVGNLRPVTRAALFKQTTGRSAEAEPAAYQFWLAEHGSRYVADETNGQKVQRPPKDLTLAVPTDLYRYFDFTGRLLYVGISTKGWATRWEVHAREKLWWPEVDVAKRNVVSYANEREARDAEMRAIDTENPKYNILRPGMKPRDQRSARRQPWE